MISPKKKRVYTEAQREAARKRTAAYRSTYPEKVKASQKISTLKNPEGAKRRNERWQVKQPTTASHRSWVNRIMRHFGVTEEQYNTLLEKQNGRCALCPNTKSTKGRALAVDHCHETGRVRGLLCTKCNVAIGSLGDNAEGLRRALAYIENA